MNDFEAPSLRDCTPPRLFTTVRAADVEYNQDFISYLVQQEDQRRAAAKLAPMSPLERAAFTADAARAVIINGNPVAALGLRS